MTTGESRPRPCCDATDRAETAPGAARVTVALRIDLPRRPHTGLSLAASVLAHALVVAAAIMVVRVVATPPQEPEQAATMLFEAPPAPTPAPTPAAPTPAVSTPAPPTPPVSTPAPSPPLPPPPAPPSPPVAVPVRAAVPPPLAIPVGPPPPAAKPARAAATAAKPVRTAKHPSRPATAAARSAASSPVAASAPAAVVAAPHHTVTAAHPVAGLAGNVAPQYTPAETRRREQGTVVLHIQVSSDGRPASVTVGSSSGYSDLDATARMTVLADWRFVPATVDGNPVPGYCFVSIHFTLRDEDQ